MDKNWTTLKVFIKALSRVTDIPVSVDQPARSVALAQRLMPKAEFAIQDEKYVYFWHNKLPVAFIKGIYE